VGQICGIDLCSEFVLEYGGLDRDLKGRSARAEGPSLGCGFGGWGSLAPFPPARGSGGAL